MTFPPAHVPPQMHRPHVPAVVKGERAHVEGSDAAKREDPRSLPEAVLICRGAVVRAGRRKRAVSVLQRSAGLPAVSALRDLAGLHVFIPFRRARPVAGV